MLYGASFSVVPSLVSATLSRKIRVDLSWRCNRNARHPISLHTYVRDPINVHHAFDSLGIRDQRVACRGFAAPYLSVSGL